MTCQMLPNADNETFSAELSLAHPLWTEHPCALFSRVQDLSPSH